METAFCTAFGAAIVIASRWLAVIRQPDWQSDGDLLARPRKELARWATVQHNLRVVNNHTLLVIGLLIALAGWLPHNQAWAVLWGSILTLVFFVLVMAVLDAICSVVSYRKALPEAARRSFTDPNRLRMKLAEALEEHLAEKTNEDRRTDSTA